MYRVAICDDDMGLCGSLESMILGYGAKVMEAFEVDVYFGGEDLYRKLKQGIVYDLIFLDIEMGGLSGIDVGRMIRGEFNNNYTGIVYISIHTSYTLDLFAYRPLDFIVKPANEERVHRFLETALKLSSRGTRFFAYKAGKTENRVELDNILYFNGVLGGGKLVGYL